MGFHVQHPDPEILGFLYREIFARQCYFFRADTRTPVIFDCGANVGMATLYFKWLYPHSRVCSFEPDPANFGVLQTNIKDNGLENVDAHNVALWDTEGTIDFFSDPEHKMLSMSADPQRISGPAAKVPSRRLSAYITEPIDFLKMDIEGAEYRVLRDLVESGKIALVRKMVIEYHHRIGTQKSCLSDFLKLLEQSGFDYEIRAQVYPSVAPYQDILISAER
jgi:FkbM family methyltransferase